MNILETLFTKIYKSIDLRWNKLINARTNNIPDDEREMKPSNPNYDGEIMINRDYVDQKTTYDTTKANKYKNPFLQWWMTNVQGKTYKELFDDLLFPRLDPQYVNPEFYGLKVNFEHGIYKNGNRHILFFGQTIAGTFFFETTTSDRSSNESALVRITYPNNIKPELIFRAENTAESSQINFNCYFVDGMTFQIERIYGPSNTTKKDTYENNSIPPEFSTNYTLTKDISELIYNQICLYSPCHKLVTNYNAGGTPQGNGLTSNALTFKALTDNGFVISDKFIIQSNVEQEYYLLFPVGITGTGLRDGVNQIFDDSRYFLELYKGDMLINRIEIPKRSLLRGNTTYKYRTITYNSTFGRVGKYIEGVYHFGVYQEEMFGRIVIENKDNKEYTTY